MFWVSCSRSNIGIIDRTRGRHRSRAALRVDMCPLSVALSACGLCLCDAHACFPGQCVTSLVKNCVVFADVCLTGFQG